jgi:hypothetical protein
MNHTVIRNLVPLLTTISGARCNSTTGGISLHRALKTTEHGIDHHYDPYTA